MSIWNQIVIPNNLTKIIKIPWYAIELIRGDVSSNFGASLANALLLDLRAMGFLFLNVDIKNRKFPNTGATGAVFAKQLADALDE